MYCMLYMTVQTFFIVWTEEVESTVINFLIFLSFNQAPKTQQRLLQVALLPSYTVDLHYTNVMIYNKCRK